jgi:hypothetical protein
VFFTMIFSASAVAMFFQRPREEANARNMAAAATGLPPEMAESFRKSAAETRARSSGWLIAVYFAAGVVAAWPLPSRWRVFHASERIRFGLCATCGYDLRASPGLCPECGTVPAGKAVA